MRRNWSAEGNRNDISNVSSRNKFPANAESFVAQKIGADELSLRAVCVKMGARGALLSKPHCDPGVAEEAKNRNAKSANAINDNQR
jgi:hypothetical protein